jgi:pimeloyl-ACP methyl ester carboxylesterase
MSEGLGEKMRCSVDGVTVEYSDTGTGPVMVFVHGVYVTGAVWSDVVDELAGRFRCVVPTWPLGAHTPAGETADLTAAAAAKRVIHFLETLDLRHVTIVANDTRGGLVLAALGDSQLDLSRIAQLVLTNCDSYEHFPPGAFRHVVTLCRISRRLGSAVLRGLASSRGQRFFLQSVCRTIVSPERQAEIFGAFATDAQTRWEAVRVTASLDPELTVRASTAIEQFDKPVTLVWGTDDELFPLTHARRLADAFPRSSLLEVESSSTYVMLDAPARLAEAIERSPALGSGL